MNKTPIEWTGLTPSVKDCHLIPQLTSRFLNDFIQQATGTAAILTRKLYYQFGMRALDLEKRQERLTEQAGALPVDSDNTLRLPFWVASDSCGIVQLYGASPEFCLEPFDNRKASHADRYNWIVGVFSRTDMSDPNAPFTVNNSCYVGTINSAELGDRVFQFFTLHMTNILSRTGRFSYVN
jgi:hypothetical protein